MASTLFALSISARNLSSSAAVHGRVGVAITSPSSSALIERALAFVGEQGDLVSHFDKSHFDQCTEIVRTDRRQFGSLAFDIAQDPAQMNCRV
jgi:hypothetical protein